MSLILYHYWRSSASWRVRWALELKKIPVEYRAINLLQAEDKRPEYLAQNPAGYVPCLVEGDFQLGESLAIIEWLEEKFPQAPLLGSNSNERAKIRQLAETVNSGMQPLQNLDVLKKLSANTNERATWVQYWATKGFGVLEAILTTLPNKQAKYCVSDEPTLADLCLIPQCYAAKRFDVDLLKFPRCHAIYEYALQTAACKKAHPDAWQPKES
jgi:maleylacetoacetate isomerase